MRLFAFSVVVAAVCTYSDKAAEPTAAAFQHSYAWLACTLSL